jgi:hypothetical protein
MVKHLLFLSLISGYVAVVHLCGMPLLLRRHDVACAGAFGFGAWAACYWEGPRIRVSLPSTSFRPEAILTGAGAMVLALVLKFGRHVN